MFTIFVVFCVSIIPFIVLITLTSKIEDGNRPIKQSQFAEISLYVTLTINTVVTSVTGLVSFFWGVYLLLSLVGVPGEWIAIIGFIALLFTFANALDHMH